MRAYPANRKNADTGNLQMRTVHCIYYNISAFLIDHFFNPLTISEYLALLLTGDSGQLLTLFNLLG